MVPITQNPDYRDLVADINEKNSALAAVVSAIDEISLQLSQGTPDDGASHVAAAIEFSRTGVAVIPSGAVGQLHEKHVLLRNQRDALEKSIRADQEAIYRLQGALSGEASTAVEVEHQAIAARALKALQEFDQACEDESKLIARLGAVGFDARFKQYVLWGHVGRLSEQSESALWHHVRELARYTK